MRVRKDAGGVGRAAVKAKSGRTRRGAAVAALAVVFAACSCGGCAKPPDYPPTLTFPPRADRLVLKTPDRQPDRVGNPEDIDKDIAALDALGGRTLDPAALPADQQKALDGVLAEMFGKPASPRLPEEPSERLTEGGKLYRRHCVQCHGMTGDGRGPTGLWVHPHPRDFRRGAFKFTTTGDGRKPRHADLVRTIREGLRGTAMPAFSQIPDGDRESLAEYVRFLSIRGQVEYQALAALLDPNADGADDLPGFARSRLAAIRGEWAKAEAVPPPPVPPELGDINHPEREASVRSGYELFTAPGGSSCASCHEDFGRKSAYRYDIWGTVIRPANLTDRDRKGGDGAEAIAARIRGGIGPSGMPAHASLTDGQVFDLSRFVRALPYPRELPPDVRQKVYPGSP